MPQQTPNTLNHFTFFSFTSTHSALSLSERQHFHAQWLAGLKSAAQKVDLYQVYPAQAGTDLLVWSAVPADNPEAAGRFFRQFARATNPYRHLAQPGHILWGYTRPSQYTRARSTQEIDPFATARAPYLTLYPFVKTVDWYLMSRDARQGMMNEHIRVGKGFPEITQLLLYSFGLQDQEFIVVYETADLQTFSELVYQLRASEARRFTERDTPLFTAIYHPAEETLALWE